MEDSLNLKRNLPHCRGEGGSQGTTLHCMHICCWNPHLIPTETMTSQEHKSLWSASARDTGIYPQQSEAGTRVPVLQG